MNETSYNQKVMEEVPGELLAQAYRIALYFAEKGVKDWTLGPIQKRQEPKTGMVTPVAGLPK